MAFNDPDKVTTFLYNKKLSSLNLFNVNDNYFEFKNQNLIVIDGGIELVFDDQTLAVAWNCDEELFDIHFGTAASLLGDLDFYPISAADLSFGQDLIGSTVLSIEIVWNWYYKLNDDLEPTGTKQYIPFELKFNFDNDRIFQIALIDYTIENQKMVASGFNSQGEMMLSIDNFQKIPHTSS